MIFKSSILLAVFLFSTSLLGKGGPASGDGTYQRPAINKVAPLEKEALVRNAHSVIQSAISGTRSIKDENCKNLQVELNTDYLEVSVDNKKYYIVENPTLINGKTFKRSTCYKSNSNKTHQIECISRTTKGITQVNQHEALLFYIKYSDTAILRCPSNGTLFE